jgi:hypothetical protein
MPTIEPASTSSARPGTLALILALVGAASMLYYHLGLFMPEVRRASEARHLAGKYSFGDDFYPIWLTTREWHQNHSDPYSSELTREIQIGLFGRALDSRLPGDPPSDYRTFAYPAYTDLLFWPASEISFPVFRFAWSALLTVLVMATVVFWARALSWRLSAISLAIMVLLVICSYQELEGLYAGQLGLLVGFLLAASLLALMRNRLWLAGATMALAMIKPQMVLLALAYLFLWSISNWRRHGRFVVAFTAMLSLLMASSIAVWPRWIQSWLRVVRGYPHYWTPPLASEILGATVRSLVGTPLVAVLLIAALAVAWRGRNAVAGSYEFWLTLSVLLALTTLTLLPGQSVCDHIILLPGIFLVAGKRDRLASVPALKALLLTGFAIILWPWIAAFSLIVLRPVLGHNVFYSKALFVLPLRTAAAFPFVVLGALILALRHAHDLAETSSASPA